MGIMNIFSKKNNKSKNVAKERLKLVLVHDRANVSPDLLENLKEELMQVIAKYVEIDKNLVDVDLNKEGNSTVLVANIPIRQLKRTKRGWEL